MKTGRFRLVLAGAILVAPPLGGFFSWLLLFAVGLLSGSEIFGSEMFNFTLWGVLGSLLAFMVFSYVFGFFPALVVGLYAARIVKKSNVLRIYKLYLLGFFVTGINLFMFSERSPESIFDIFSAVTIGGMTASFFTLYYIAKNSSLGQEYRSPNPQKRAPHEMSFLQSRRHASEG